MGHGALVKSLALGLGVLALAACEPQTTPTDDTAVRPGAQVFASASLGPFDDHVNAITFVPVTTVPWEGRLIIAAQAGGLKVVDIEGKEDSNWSGATITALAAHPGFNLRGLETSVVLALKDDGGLLSFIVDDARGQLIELPVSGLPDGNITTVCTVKTGDKAPAFLIGNADKTLDVWSLSDNGNAQLSAQKLQSGKLAVAISNCAASSTNAMATGAKGGLFRLSVDNGISMVSGVESAPGQVIVADNAGTKVILVSDPAAGNLHAYDENLLPLYDLLTPKALSTPGAANPGALALSARSFGGAGFSAGLIAVADDSTNRIALVVLDTIPAKADASAP